MVKLVYMHLLFGTRFFVGMRDLDMTGLLLKRDRASVP